YRGEAWGTWSQVTYLNQRHFASAIGILLLVLVFLVIRYRAVPAKRANECASADITKAQEDGVPEPDPISSPGNPSRLEDVREPQTEMASVSVVTEPRQETIVIRERLVATLPPFIFCGVLLGLLPMWNSALFIAAAAILGLLFIF